MGALRTVLRYARRRRRAALAQALIAALVLQLISAALPPATGPANAPLGPNTAAAETLSSPRYVSTAVMPSGQVGLLYANGDNGVNTAAEIRFSRYSSEHALDNSIQLSTAGPAYPQLATFRGRLVAAYVDTRSPNSGRLIVRASDDNGATWSAESYPFGAETFDGWTFAPRVVASRDGQTLFAFKAANGSVPQYRSTTDATLVTWTAWAAAGDATMRVASANNCGSAGSECYRAHAFGFMETATAGRWIYIAKSDAGFGQSGRGTQVGALGGAWSAQVDHGGSGGIFGGGDSTATTFLDRVGNVYFIRAGGSGDQLYLKKATDGGYTWGAQLNAYGPSLANYTTAAPVGLFASPYVSGEYVWYAGFGGSENALRVIPLWTTTKAYGDTGTVRLFGSAGSDLDLGSAYEYNFGNSVRSLGAGSYSTGALDLALPGRILPFAFGRTYNSADVAVGPLGPGWTHSYDWRVRERPTADIDVRRGDGRTDTFTRNPDGTYRAPVGVFDALVKNIDGTLTLTTREQLRYEFSTEGWLTRVREPAGNQITLTAENADANWSMRPPLGASAAYWCDPQYSSFTCDKIADGSRSDTGGSDDNKYVALSSGTRQATVRWTGGSAAVMTKVTTVTVRYRWSRNATIRCGGAPGGSLGTLLATDTVTQVDGTYRTWTATVNASACTGLDSIGFVADSNQFTVEVVELEARGTAAGRPGTISDSVGRVVTLGYDGSGHLGSLSDNSGRTVRYEYDPSGRLSAVWDPLGSTKSAAYASTVTSDTPAGYWRSEETSGTALADQRGVQAGTVGGGVIRGVGGIAGSSATSYDGTGYGSIPSNAAFNFGLGAYTVETWVYRTGPGTHSWPVIVSKRPWQNAAEAGWAITSMGADPTKIALHVNNLDLGDPSLQTPTGVLTANAWHHVALAYAPSDLKGRLYVDGNLVLTTPATNGTTGASSSAAISIGRNNTGSADYLQGRVDEIAVYPTALSQARIQAHYAAGTVRASWQYGYDGATRHLTTITDPDGRVVVTNSYDAAGRLFQQKDGLQKTTTFGYSGSTVTTTDPRAHQTTITYDPRNRPIQVSDVVGTSTYTLQYGYDGCGDRSFAFDRNGQRTDYTYDTACKGNLLARDDPQLDPQTPRYHTAFEYDAKNNLTKITDPRGFITTYSYDPTTNVRLSSSAQIDATTSAVTKWEYTDAANPGLPTFLTAPRGNTGATPDHAYAQTLAYDAQANLTSSTDADGHRATYGYDSVGRRTSMVDADGNAAGGVPSEHTWSTVYDANDRVTSQIDALGHATLYAYDGAGHRAGVTDRNGNVTTYAYDGAGRLRTVQQKPDPAGQPTLVYTTTVDRDDSGNAIKVTQGNGVATDYGYDALDRLTTVTTHPTPTTPLVTSYTLDGNGNTTQRTTGDTVTTTYVYDALSRLTSVSAVGLATISYGYDQRSQRTSMTDGTGASTYSYDGLGRLTQAVQPSGTTAYGYDLDSDRTSLTYPGSQAVTYSFSNAGRLSSLTDWAGRTTGYTYTASGLAKTVTLPASLGTLFTNYAYDRAQRLTSLTNVVGSTTVTSHDYTLDPEGDRTALAEYVSGITAMGGSDSFSLAYDGLLRLTGVAVTNPESFSLDGASNLSSRTGPNATYSYDQSNRLTGDGTLAYTWSNADRLTIRGNDLFGYDALDRLTSSTVSGTARSYAYNGDGLLQSRSAATSDTFLWDPATSPSRLLMQNGDKIVYGLGPLYAVKADGSTTAFARDGGKSVRAEISSSGAVTSSFRYRAYGSLIQWSGPSSPSYLGYAGQLVDPSGLLYMRARWYDPTTGRFLTEDPLLGRPTSTATLNPYGYGAGNPVQLADPSGTAVVSSDAPEGGKCVNVTLCLLPEQTLEETDECSALCALVMLPAFQAPFDQKWNDQVRRAIREGTDADAPIENAAPTTYGDVIRPGSDWQRVARYEEPATNPKYSGMTSAQEIYQNRLTGQRSLFHVIEQPGTGRIVGIHHIHFRPYLKVRSGTRAVD